MKLNKKERNILLAALRDIRAAKTQMPSGYTTCVMAHNYMNMAIGSLVELALCDPTINIPERLQKS